MPTERIPYRPLGPRARDPFGVVVTSAYRLYLGDDHLLYVTNQRFSETYKRFYFRDIQALVWTQNDRRNTYSLILLLCLLGAGLLSLLIGSATDAGSGLLVMTFFGLLLGVAGAVNITRGPTCTAYIQTAVHTQRLTPIGRVRLAERILAEITPRITAAQGEWAPGTSPSEVAAQSVPPVIVTPPADPTSAGEPKT